MNISAHSRGEARRRYLANLAYFRKYAKESWKKKKKLPEAARLARNAAQREWQKNNKDKATRYRLNFRKKILARYSELKKELGLAKCKRCPQKHPAALDLHHVNPKKKEFQISWMLTKDEKIIRKEMKKCICLCASCHRIEHWRLRQKE